MDAPARLPLDGAAPLGGQRDRGVAGGTRLVLGERAVGSPEAQGERQRLLALADLRPGVDVEEPDRLEQLPRALAQGRLDVRGRAPTSSTTSATSSLATGKSENVRGGDDRRRRARAAGRGRSRRRRCGPGRRTPRTPAGAARRRDRATASPTRISAQRPGCQGARDAARTVDRRRRAPRPCGGRRRPRRPRSACTALAPPAGAFAVAGDDEPEVQRLVRQRLVELVELALGRPRSTPKIGAGPVARGKVTVAASNRARSVLPRPALRATALSRPGSSVVVIAGSSDDSGLASRSTCRRGSSSGSASASRSRVADEREAHHLDEPLARQRATDAAAQLLAPRSARARGPRAGAPTGRWRSRRSGRPPRPGRRGR